MPSTVRLQSIVWTGAVQVGVERVLGANGAIGGAVRLLHRLVLLLLLLLIGGALASSDIWGC